MPQPRDPYLRQRVLDLRASNKSADWIASHLNVPKRTVYEWCRGQRESARVDLESYCVQLESIADDLGEPRLWDLAILIKKAVTEMNV